ncbi:putative bifunctional diguanylate cyclase/phosphodiesterase [Piscinibacter sakaiensis]|uniref:putative bifunctional diguanylate cyclase/phosphodiesterase n=1 Tax=Piscinibacter sakaiensis TaxID=1547922 RepID=UPI003AAA77CE
MSSIPLPPGWQGFLARWRQDFHVYRATDPDSAAIRARHMQSIGRLTPLMMFANLAGGVLLATSLRERVPMWELAPWLAMLLLVCGSAIHNWWDHLQHPRAEVSPAAIRRAVSGATLFGLLWGGAAVAWLASIPLEQQLLLATLVVGMMCGGAFALASVPQAASAYLGIITLASVVALLRAGGVVYLNMVVLVLVYGCLLGLCVLTSARIHTARLVSEREAERQGQLVELLLRDFEEHSADLLWEVGCDGRFSRVSTRLAGAFGRSEAQMRGTGLIEIMVRQLPFDQPETHVNRLAATIAAGKPYKDLIVPVQTVIGPRWWSLTARPLEGEGGGIVGWRGVIADVTDAHLAQERLEHQAHSDSLTGLANRLQLREHLQRAVEDVQVMPQAATPFALICLDVDFFKAINDALGHSVGDAVLIEVANRLRGSLREADLAARVGGDEFAIVIDLADGTPQLHAMARRIVRALCQPFRDGDHLVSLSVSIGIAIAPDHGTTLDELLTHADLALYEAKERGRGRYELFTPVLGERHRRRTMIAQQLRGALDRNELSLAWQPQVDIASWRIVGAEVLLRWQHPTLGHVSPADFIAVAEESGQINAIGAWVLEQACLGAANLPDSISVSVNASTAQLMQEDFVDLVARALQHSALAPQRLKIEITESLFMDAVPVALANLHGLRALGVAISLDDFGTGFSSLAYLLRFPFDVLKIDRSFVLEMMARDDARALVRSIVEMAASLGMGTVAEGVEDVDQLDVLRQAGCAQIQGYLVARPMPLPQLELMLIDWKQGAGRPDLQATRTPAERVAA